MFLIFFFIQRCWYIPRWRHVFLLCLLSMWLSNFVSFVFVLYIFRYKRRILRVLQIEQGTLSDFWLSEADISQLDLWCDVFWTWRLSHFKGYQRRALDLMERIPQFGFMTWDRLALMSTTLYRIKYCFNSPQPCNFHVIQLYLRHLKRPWESFLEYTGQFLPIVPKSGISIKKALFLYVLFLYDELWWRF